MGAWAGETWAGGQGQGAGRGDTGRGMGGGHGLKAWAGVDMDREGTWGHLACHPFSAPPPGALP